MPKPTKGPRIGGSPAHQRIILANLASQLFEHGRITTTETKAKRVRPLAERLISKAKRGDLHNRRQVLSVITDSSIVDILFHEIAPKMDGRDGGFTRITKIGPRKGDNAPMAIIEILDEAVAPRADGSKSSDEAKAQIQAAADTEQAEASADNAESTDAAEAASDDAKNYGEGSYRGDEAPEGFDIKGNENSMKFHTPESPSYDRTIAEVWFNSTEAAEAAGFVNAVSGGDDEADQA